MLDKVILLRRALYAKQNQETFIDIRVPIDAPAGTMAYVKELGGAPVIIGHIPNQGIIHVDDLFKAAMS